MGGVSLSNPALLLDQYRSNLDSWRDATRIQWRAALKALAGPFGGVRFCPTGGIGPDNLQRYMAQPNVMCVGGTWMFQREWVQNSDWARIQQCSAESLQLLD